MRAPQFFALFIVTLGPALHAQQLLVYPQDLAGRWEAPDGHGGAVGMNILVSTTVPSSAMDLTGVSQKLEYLEIDLYRRSGSDVEMLGPNFIATSTTREVSWKAGRLRIDSRQDENLPEVHLDLIWNENTRFWTGKFARAAFHRRAIALRRPSGLTRSLLSGTWFEPNGAMNNCLHVAQAKDGTVAGWSDDILVPGRLRYANGHHPPERTWERYGEVAKVKITGPGRVEVELRANTALCCSHRFAAAISRNGDSLIGRWPAGPNQAPRAARWVRVPGDSCIAEASDR